MQGYNEIQKQSFWNAAFSAFVVLTFLAVSALGVVANPQFAAATNGVDDALKAIEAKALVDHECNVNEWHFVITGITDDLVAPDFIKVLWNDNVEYAPLALEKVTGHTAHYRTTEYLDGVVANAKAYIDNSWDGQFNVSHGPCIGDQEEETEETVEEEEETETPTEEEEEEEVVEEEETPLANNSCPFDPMEGRTIIDFEDGVKILSSKAPHYLQEDVSVSAGTYVVTLATFDGYNNRSSKTPQPQEIWKLILKTSDYEEVATSNATNDILDTVDFVSRIDQVNDALVVSETANIAKAWHAASDNAPTANSLEPVCAALDLVQEQGENQKPVITLIGDPQIIITVGGNFSDEGSTANDAEDGDITSDIVVGGDSVDEDTIGTYVLTYNVVDSEGLSADEVTREVIVKNKPQPKAQCGDGTDNDGDNLVDSDDPGCHTDGDATNDASYDPSDDDETHEMPYAPYCGDGLVNQEWESCDAGLVSDNQCTAQCQVANQCVNRAFARVNTDDLSNYTDGDVTSDIFLGSNTNKIPGGAWFLLFDNGTFVIDPNANDYDDVPGLAVERREGKVRTVLHGSHPHNGSKEHIDGNVEFFNIEATSVLDDLEGNNNLENGFDNVMDNVPGQDEVWLSDSAPAQSFFYLTVTTADDGFFTTYSEVPQCELPNQAPEINLLGDNPLIISLFGTFTDPGFWAYDHEDGDVTPDVVIGGDSVDTNTVGNYTITYNVVDSEGLAATEATRVVRIVDGNGGPDPVCSDGADNDGDLVADQNDAGCHTDGDVNNPDSYDPNGTSENEIPVISLRGSSTINVILGGVYTEESADVDDTEDGDIDGNLVIAGDTVDTNATGTYSVTYNAVDSQGANAVEVTRTVNVVEEGEVNEKPVITLTGSASQEVNQGSTYIDGGATANDTEDGDITSDLVVVNPVDTATLGAYTITYDVVDSQGLAADTVTRTVTVINPSSNPPGGGGGGGSTSRTGGSGGFIPNSLKITNEQVTVIGEGTALITWKTNKPATSRVVFDDDSQTLDVTVINFGTGSTDLGYEFTTTEVTTLVTEHSVIVTNVNLGDTFYFRPISTDGTRAVGIELSAVLGVVDAASCSQYLFEFIKFGENNNVTEVTKLQNFLNELEGNNLRVTGVYDRPTFDAVVAFQRKYADDILSPWGLQTDTGYVYLTTRKKINEIYCNFQLEFPLTAEQLSEVNTFKGTLDSLREQGLPLPDTSNVGLVPSTPTFAENTDTNEVPSVVITEETGVGESEGEENEDSLAAALEAVEGEGRIGGFFNRVSNFFRGIFK